MNLSSPNYLIANFDKRWPLPQPGTPDHLKALIRNHYGDSYNPYRFSSSDARELGNDNCFADVFNLMYGNRKEKTTKERWC